MRTYIQILVLLFSVHTSLSAFSANTCQEDDYIGLRTLYLNTNGDNWTNNTGWLTAAEFTDNPNMPTGTDLSTWHGITTNDEGCVSELRLIYNQLSGSIPAALGNLSSLESLNLSENQLSGNIPVELGNLNSLKVLSLPDNQLSGSIPVELGNLNSLKALWLRDNQLSGSIPVELANIGSFKHIALQNNQLSGSIPVEIGGLNNLELLGLSNNQLSGNIPVELGNLSELKYLYLDKNQFTNGVPELLGNLNNLEYLILYDNQLSGCYDAALMSLCTQLEVSTNGYISDGNNFDAAWENFCAIGVDACMSTDIDNTHQSTFTVYPIPAKDVVIFDVPNIAAADEIILYDITGREISRQAFPQDKQLTVSHLNDGVYIYRIFYDNDVYSGKIVVE